MHRDLQPIPGVRGYATHRSKALAAHRSVSQEPGRLQGMAGHEQDGHRRRLDSPAHRVIASESAIGSDGEPGAAAQATDTVTLLQDVPLTEDEAGYVEAARAANTMRGYRSDWREFTAWCTGKGLDPLPAAPATITGYLTDLAHAGAKVGTMSRRCRH